MTNGAVQDPGTKGWPAPKQEPEGIPAEDLTYWRQAIDRTREIALREGWSRAEVARRADIPAPTLTQLLDGTYNPGSIATQAGRLTRWLDAYDETRSLAAALPEVPGWVSTPTGEEVMRTLLLCQQMPDMAVITLGSGMGKTITAAHYCATRPSAYRVTMRPSTATVGKMMREIAAAIDITERNPAKLDRAIGARLKRNGRTTLLVIDEAQNLVDQAVDQLRWFLDEYECGIALLGNTDLYTRFGRGTPKDGYGQIHRRIGRRFSRVRPLERDIEAVIHAWKIESREIADLLRGIGRKPGALGQITKTMQLAAIWAAGDGRSIDAGHVRAAWENRSGEEGAR